MAIRSVKRKAQKITIHLEQAVRDIVLDYKNANAFVAKLKQAIDEGKPQLGQSVRQISNIDIEILSRKIVIHLPETTNFLCLSRYDALRLLVSLKEALRTYRAIDELNRVQTGRQHLRNSGKLDSDYSDECPNVESIAEDNSDSEKTGGK